MKKYFLAKTHQGQEYMYSIDSAMLCSEKNKLYFMELLNNKRYELKNENEIWHLYENDWFTNERIYKEIVKTKTRVYVKHI